MINNALCIKIKNAGWEFQEFSLRENVNKLKLESTSPEVAKINENGQIECVGPGTTTIRAALGNVTAEKELDVYLPIESITLPQNIEMTVGETIEIEPTFYPANTNISKKIEWSKSDVFLTTIKSSDIYNGL